MAGNNEEVVVGHWKRDSTDVYIGCSEDGNGLVNVYYPNKGWLGNPYSISEYGRKKSMELFEQTLARKIVLSSSFWRRLTTLRGCVLGCSCRAVDEEAPPVCHGDVIAKWVNTYGGVCSPTEIALDVGWDIVRQVQSTLAGSVHVRLDSGRGMVRKDARAIVDSIDRQQSTSSVEPARIVPEGIEHQ